jgi:hypothetical protein
MESLGSAQLGFRIDAKAYNCDTANLVDCFVFQSLLTRALIPDAHQPAVASCAAHHHGATASSCTCRLAVRALHAHCY